MHYCLLFLVNLVFLITHYLKINVGCDYETFLLNSSNSDVNCSIFHENRFSTSNHWRLQCFQDIFIGADKGWKNL